ncbi:MAG: hypothetical protein GX606_03905 [Elusimicrobia bacterium]|nr:hypothetical protein [Elusimicrobiota bacterium]
MKKGDGMRAVFLFFFLMVSALCSSVSAATGTICNGSPTGWDFFHCAYPNCTHAINCDARSDKCCASGNITTANSSSWVPARCSDWSYVCSGACTPTGRLVVNYGSCSPSCTPKTCAYYPGQCGNLDNDCGGTITCNCPSGQHCDSGTCAVNQDLKVKKGGVIYNVETVPVTDPDASRVRVRLNGEDRALRRMP